MKQRNAFLGILLALCLLLTACSPAGASMSVPEHSAGLTVYYLDVGQADAAVLLCDGEVMMIDGGNAGDSDFIYAWLEKQGIDKIDVMVCSHSHEDHVGGLSGALNYATVTTAYAPVAEADTKVFSNFVYYLEEQDVSITVPEAGDTFGFGSAQVEFLGPVEDYDDPNNTSLVMRITYGETSFLFTGDMETKSEEDMLDAYWDLSATVLKVAHHGSDTSSSMEFLEAVDPAYAVISVGEDNEYGHPMAVVLDRLAELAIPVYRTDELGTICCVSDGKTLTFTSEENADLADYVMPEREPQPQPSAATYIGNKNTEKFHSTDCSKLPEPENQIVFDSRQAAVDAGYSPCGICEP